MTASPRPVPLRHTVYVSAAPQARHARLRRGHRIIRHRRAARTAPAQAGGRWSFRLWLAALVRAPRPGSPHAEQLHALTLTQRALRREAAQGPQDAFLSGRLTPLPAGFSPARGPQGDTP